MFLDFLSCGGDIGSINVISGNLVVFHTFIS